jgi:hypothetical protein
MEMFPPGEIEGHGVTGTMASLTSRQPDAST